MVKSVAFSPDGKRLATPSKDQTVKLWDAQPRLQDTSSIAYSGEDSNDFEPNP